MGSMAKIADRSKESDKTNFLQKFFPTHNSDARVFPEN